MKVKNPIPVTLLAVVLILICWFSIPFTYIKDGGSIEDITVEFHDDEKDETGYYEDSGYYEDCKLSAEQEKAAAQILQKMKCTHKLNSFGAFQLRFYPFRIDCMADGKSCHIFLGKSGIVYDGTNGWASEGRITNAEALTEEFRALLEDSAAETTGSAVEEEAVSWEYLGYEEGILQIKMTNNTDGEIVYSDDHELYQDLGGRSKEGTPEKTRNPKSLIPPRMSLFDA